MQRFARCVDTWIDRCTWLRRRDDDDNDDDDDDDDDNDHHGRDGNASQQQQHADKETNKILCHSETCRYCYAAEKALLWEDTGFFFNFCLLLMYILLVVVLGMPCITELPLLNGNLTVHIFLHVMIVFMFVDFLAPTEDHRFMCSRLHMLYNYLQEMRSKEPGLHCSLLCIVAVVLWFIGRADLVTPHSLYWSISLGSLITLQIPLLAVNIFEKAMDLELFNWRKIKEWYYDSDNEDEFLPVVSEANLQVLHRFGETGDNSPTPTSVISETQNDPFEEYLENLFDTVHTMPSHEDGSTDGVELSELELSVGENDVEEDIKFQIRHFEKSSSSASDDDVFDDKKITAESTDDSNSDSDFEIIDKAEIDKM
ncbi:uncharacterized protein LOC109862665 [Pseudomyrmex gracilis]|uniref:uncharacterized protein LOC109862665 n=1 Tax=Pseudomyrmex gracilis TaxID=219809 RepID=UPI0009956800|nr:uncharacterized protein LOC109862665 [Pseudomyrmex gracilis]